MKRSKSLPALKSFFTKNDFNAGKLPALKSFFAKNRFIAGKDFERFMWFARMRVSGNRYEFELMSRRIKFSLNMYIPMLVFRTFFENVSKFLNLFMDVIPKFLSV